MTGTLQVEVDGCDEHVAGLTWSQHAQLTVLRALGANTGYLNVPAVVLPDRAVPEETCRAALAQLLREVEVLRTVVDDTRSPAVQHVHARAVLRCDVRDVEPDDVRRVAATLTDGCYDTVHLRVDEPGVRATVLRTGAGVAAVVLVLTHLVADAHARDLVAERLSTLLRTGGRPSGLPAVQAREQVQHETREDTRMFAAAAVEHWRALLAATPRASMPVLGPDPEAPQRFVRGRLVSEAVAAASTVASERLQVSSSAVLLAASLLLLDRWHPAARAPVKVVAQNRVTPRDRTVLAPMVQDGLLAPDLRGRGFDDAVRTCFLASLEATQLGAHDPAALAPVVAGVELPYLFNDVRPGGVWPEPLHPTGPADLARLAERSTVSLPDAWHDLDVHVYPHVHALGPACDLGLTVDTHRVPVARLRAALRGLERLLVACAWQDAAPDRVTALLGDAVLAPQGAA